MLDRDRFVYAPSQWEMPLECNVVSHWLGAYMKWSLLDIWQLSITDTKERRIDAD